jgi:voltage-gated potassium channel
VDAPGHNRSVKSPSLERTVAPPAIIVALACLLAGAGAAAAFESDTVGNFWGGLWWALCLMTTVGYVYGPPDTTAATIVSAVLIVVGFVLLSLLSATLAAVFIRRDEQPAEKVTADLEREILARLDEISRRVEALEKRLP